MIKSAVGIYLSYSYLKIVKEKKDRIEAIELITFDYFYDTGMYERTRIFLPQIQGVKISKSSLLG